jgi:hypothetical protein
MFSAAGSRTKAALKAAALAKGKQTQGTGQQRSIDSWAISSERTPSPHPADKAHDSLPEVASNRDIPIVDPSSKGNFYVLHIHSLPILLAYLWRLIQCSFLWFQTRLRPHNQNCLRILLQVMTSSFKYYNRKISFNHLIILIGLITEEIFPAKIGVAGTSEAVAPSSSLPEQQLHIPISTGNDLICQPLLSQRAGFLNSLEFL